MHRLDRKTRRSQTLRQVLGIGMVLGQALHVMIQRIQAGRRQIAGLAHAATDHLAQSSSLGDQLHRTTEHRAHWRAQAFGQAH
ncbi:hypothetical protein D3C81_2083510 [compost metagenome]